MKHFELGNLINHLWYENNKSCKEFALNKCVKILGNIAKAKDRISNLQRFDDAYSREKIYTLEKAIKRLEIYYNTCINRLEKF